jgi:cadmium resistance protein CadD (predicted permease)
MEVANIIALSAMAFVSANIDGMIIAVAFLSDPSYESKNVLFGQILGFWILTILSLLIAQAFYVVPRESLGWLGLVPIIFGCVKIFNLLSQNTLEFAAIRPSGRQIQEISILTIATGADEVIAYAPIFATRKPHEISILFVMFVIMTVIWWIMARWLAEHQAVRRVVAKGGRILVPLLMISIGVVILSDG